MTEPEQTQGPHSAETEAATTEHLTPPMQPAPAPNKLTIKPNAPKPLTVVSDLQPMPSIKLLMVIKSTPDHLITSSKTYPHLPNRPQKKESLPKLNHALSSILGASPAPPKLLLPTTTTPTVN